VSDIAKTFWLIWCKDGGTPHYRHENYWGAQNEAQRLARANPGKQFVVLEATHAFEVNDMKQTEFKQDADIPF
jgi:hypothetical protein